jgi:hypothetical protein
LNIAAIDQAGINVTELPKPSYIQLTEKQTTSQFADFETGGLSLRGIKQESNAKTLNSYNNNLEAAAQAMKNVVLRDPSIVNNGDKIRAFKIEPGTQSAVSINGFTPEIERELASTSFANAPAMQMGTAKESAPQEQVPTELTKIHDSLKSYTQFSENFGSGRLAKLAFLSAMSQHGFDDKRARRIKVPLYRRKESYRMISQ